MYDVAIIGGGASGMLASILLGRAGHSVAIIEKHERVGKKLLATGNGRCNLSNKIVDDDSYNTGFAREIVGRFNSERTRHLFMELGLHLRAEGELLYPYSLQANSILNIFLQAMEKYGVKIIGNCLVDSLTKSEKGFVVDGKFEAKNVIISCGSASGGGVDNKRLLSGLGLEVTRLSPSLTQILTEPAATKGMSGVRVRATARLEVGGKVVDEEEGEVLFKDNSLSGIAIFNLSATIARRNLEGAIVTLDLLAELDRESAYALLFKLKEHHKNWLETLEGLLPKAVAVGVLRHGKVEDTEISFTGNAVSSAKKIVEVLKRFEFVVKGLGGFVNSQVTSGGVATCEVDKNTLELKKVEGCFITGEALDVDGKCGGHNLQWAWSSAFVVANAIAAKQGRPL